MPIKNSAKKALRQAKKRAEANKIVRDAARKAIKTVVKNLEAKKDVTEELRLAQKTLDKAAKKGIIKAKTASRKLSRLSKRAFKAK